MKESTRKWIGLLVTSLSLAIIIIDTTVLNVSLKDLIRDLNTDLQTMQWIITIYSLILAAFTITGGRLGDLYGRKKMFLIGASLFALGSFIASISTSAGMLLIGWSVIEGIGAALMMPATASILVTMFQGKERAVAFGVWGGVAGAASAVGPLLGGYLTDNYSWNWAFRINVVVVLIVLVMSFVLKETLDKKEEKWLDKGGTILSALAMSFIVYGLVEASTYGWFFSDKLWNLFGTEVNLHGLSITPIAIFLGLIFSVLFALWERKIANSGKTPLVSLGIFKNKQFVAGLTVNAILALGQTGIIFAIPIFLQAVKGLNAFDTGKAFLPLSISVLIIAPLSGFLRRKFNPRDMIHVGTLIMMAGAYFIYTKLSINTTSADLAFGLFLLGAGMGLNSSQISNITLSALDSNYAGEASGVNSTIRQLGASLGSAIIGSVFIVTMNASMINLTKASSILPPPMKEGIVKEIEKGDSNSAFSQRPQNNNTPAAISNEIRNITLEATVEGNKKGMLITMWVYLLSIPVIFLIPRKLNAEGREELAANAAH